MALVLMLICTLMTSVSIVKEKELGTMEILLVSPFKPIYIIFAKAIPYFIISLVNLVIILLSSVYLLGLPVKGSVFLLFFESTLFIVTSLSIGLIITTITNSQQAALGATQMIMMLPAMLLTGFMFPVENMPWALRVLSNIVPSRWYFIIVKDVMLKGLGFAAVWKETLILAGMSAIFLYISIRNFKIRLS
jgi:ABC-2 type transport system permease protein